MEVRVSEYIPKTHFLTATGTFEVSAVAEVTKDKKDGSGQYQQIEVQLVGSDEHGSVYDGKISVWEGDLRPLARAWGSNTDAWIGQKTQIKTVRKGEFMKWVLLPITV